MRCTLALLALASLAACTYDPPPEVNLGGPADRRYDVGAPIPIVFSEPIEAATLEIAVWPHEPATYDAEGNRLAGIEPLLAACSPATSPCGDAKGVSLSLDDSRTTATLTVAPGALGAPGKPLVMEIKGSLTDDAGRSVNVSRWLPFQIVGELPPCLNGTAGSFQPGDVVEGPHLFWASFDPPPIPLTQQFFADIQVDEASGQWVALMTDADAMTGADKTTADPTQLTMDTGAESFMFSATGCLTRDADGGIVFQSEPFDLELTIGPITFALRGTVIKGRIAIDEATGRSRWDGLMTVAELYFNSGSQERTYTEADGLLPANFQLGQILESEVPEGMPRVCDADPCLPGIQTCNLVSDFTWPPAAMCE